ncbi:hypothetical protein AKJ16_DCAP25467 [Drosera capensis]
MAVVVNLLIVETPFRGSICCRKVKFCSRSGRRFLSDTNQSDCTSQQDNADASAEAVCEERDPANKNTDSISKSSREAETGNVLLEAIDPVTESSIKSVICSDIGHPSSRKRKEPGHPGAEASRMDTAEVGSGSKVNEESSSSNSSHLVLSEPSQSKGDELMQVEGKHCKKIKLQVDETSVETVGFSSVDSIDVRYICIETKGKIESSMERNASDDSKTEQSPENGATFRDDKLPGDNTDDVAIHGQSPRVFEFDLNEDLVADDDPVSSQQSNSGSVSVHGPIAVVAKIGVPVGFPRTPLQFDGELGWKRGVTPSAFRPAKIRRTIQNLGQSLSCRGIDLNIAIGAENLAMEPTCVPTTSGSHMQESSVKISSKQASKFILDLNSKNETDEHRPKCELQGFDLNDAYSDVYHTGQCGQSAMKCVTVDSRAASIAAAKLSNFANGPRPAYWVDLSAMPGFAHGQQTQPFVVAAAPGAFSSTQQIQASVPFQSKFSFAMPTAPGGMPTAMYSPIILPPLSGQNGAASGVPQMPGTMLTAYPGSIHFMDGSQRVSPYGMTNLRPSFILGSGLTSLQNINHGGNIVDFLVPGRNMSGDARVKSFHQVSVPPTSMKRRELDNGRGLRPLTIDGLSRGARII